MGYLKKVFQIILGVTITLYFWIYRIFKKNVGLRFFIYKMIKVFSTIMVCAFALAVSFKFLPPDLSYLKSMDPMALLAISLISVLLMSFSGFCYVLFSFLKLIAFNKTRFTGTVSPAPSKVDPNLVTAAERIVQETQGNVIPYDESEAASVEAFSNAKRKGLINDNELKEFLQKAYHIGMDESDGGINSAIGSDR